MVRGFVINAYLTLTGTSRASRSPKQQQTALTRVRSPSLPSLTANRTGALMRTRRCSRPSRPSLWGTPSQLGVTRLVKIRNPMSKSQLRYFIQRGCHPSLSEAPLMVQISSSLTEGVTDDNMRWAELLHSLFTNLKIILREFKEAIHSFR